MFYHQRPSQYVTYGKVHPQKTEDEEFARAYRWLGQYCGYAPQIWLSRSTSCITGFNRRPDLDLILFGFENIKGFPIDYNFWCELLNLFFNVPSVEYANEALNLYFEDRASTYEECGDSDRVHEVWKKTQNVDEMLRQCLFCENDQVVVPSLNLKAAKVIFCRTDRQKKELWKMGFIEDRIKVSPRRPHHHQY
jgi:hypothetical protein